MSRHQPRGWATYANHRDDTAAHQLRIVNVGHRIAWSCTCQRLIGNAGYAPLGGADGLTDQEILAAHADHLAEAGAA